MLENALAEKFIEKIAECTDYNVNIMNEKGIIIASKDKSRVGTFHEIAYEIIRKKLLVKEVEAEDTYLGVKAGINMALEYQKDIVGVVGITGDLESIRPIALIIKKTVETILEYELQREHILKRRTAKENFLNYLLYEDINKKELKKMAQGLGYSTEVMRIPILIVLEKGINPEEMLKKIRGGDTQGKEDIAFVNREGEILIFKAYRERMEGFFEQYKWMLKEYLYRFLRYINESHIECRIYVGSVQKNMENYRYSYRHCQWMKEEVTSEEKIVSFYDHIDEYMKHQLPFMELHKVFDVFAEQYTDEFKKMYEEHIGALYRNNFNLQESSKSLYIHKNTLAFRLDKIRVQIGLNPIKNVRDRDIVNYFYYYLKELG